MWVEALVWATTDGASINTTAAETIIFPDVTIPANYMADGRTLRMRVKGKHSTLGSGTVTTTFRVRWGGVAGTLLAASGAIVQLISLTNCYFDLEVFLVTRSNGSTGTIMANGTVRMHGATVPTIGSATGAPAIAPMTAGGQTAPAAVTANLIADTALSVTAQMGASSASNIIQGLQYTLEALN
jgi:hypothetical protein